MSFSEAFLYGIRQRPYFFHFREKGRVLADTSLLYKTVFYAIALPLTLPLWYTVTILIWQWFPSDFVFSSLYKASVFQIIVEIGLVLYGILAFRERRYRPFLSSTHVVFIGAGFIFFAAALVSPDPRMAFFSNATRADGLFFLFHVLLYILLLSWVINAKPRFEYIWYLALWAGLFSIAGVMIISGMHSALHLPSSLRQAEQLVLGNTGFYGHYLLLLLFLTTYFLFTRPRRIYVIAAIIFFLFIFVSLSSTAIFISALLLILLLWRISRRWAYGASIAGLLLMGLSVALDHPMIYAIFDFSESISIRGKVWLDALRAVYDNSPVWGYGWGNSEIVWNALARDSWEASGSAWQPIFFDRAHNIIVEFFIAAGGMGLFAFFAIGVGTVGRAISRLLRERNHIWGFFLITFVAHGLYLAFNFDAIISYVVMGSIIAAFAFFGNEKRVVASEKRMPSLIVSVICVIISIGLFCVTLPSVRAYWHVKQAEDSAQKEPGKNTLDMLAQIERAGSINPPAMAVLAEIGPIFDRLVATGYLAYLSSDDAVQIAGAIENVYKKIHAAYPMNPYFYYQHAVFSNNFSNDLSTSSANFRAAVSLAPNKGVTRFHLGLTYARQGREERAAQLFQTLRQEGLYPGMPEFYLGLIDVEAGRLRSGHIQILTGLTHYVPMAQEWDLLVSFYFSRADKGEFFKWYDQILRIAKFSPYPYEIAVRIARKEGDEDRTAWYEYVLHRRKDKML